jgi:hypothetical protein
LLARADQAISLASYMGIIASGATYKLAAWLGGFAGQAVVNVEMSRAAGSYNDGYADNLSLTIVPKS